MRILFVNRWVGSHRGGTETHIRELALSLSRRGHQVHILTTRGKELEPYRSRIRIWYVDRALGEEYSSGKFVRIRATIFLWRSFLKMLELQKQGHTFDILSIHFALEAYFAYAIRFLFRIPFVFVFEGYSRIEGIVGGGADLNIAISNDITEKCAKAHGYRPTMIPPGVDLGKFKPSHGTPRLRRAYCNEDEKLVLSVCQLISRKDIPTLIDAAAIVRKSSGTIKFVIVGDKGPERNTITRKIRDLSLESSVFLVDSADYDQLPQYYQAADLFVLPTLYEGFGIVFIEAMASGIPIVSTTARAVPEVVGDAGLLVQPRDPIALAEKILALLQNPSLIATLRERGLSRAKRYDWEGIASRYERLMMSTSTLARDHATGVHALSLMRAVSRSAIELLPWRTHPPS